jgi:hypothetical protein
MHHLPSDTALGCQSGYVCYKSRNFAYAARTGHVPPERHLIGEPARRVQLCRELVLRVKRDVQSFRSSRSQLNGNHTEGLMQSRVVHGDSHGYMLCKRGSSACWIRHNSVGRRRATHNVCVYALRLLAYRMEQQLGRRVGWSCPALLAIGLWRD